VEEIDFEIGHFLHISDLHDLDLDLGSGHTTYHHVSLIYLYLPNLLLFKLESILWMDEWTGRQTLTLPLIV